jgi:hypothetical protein
VTLLDRLRKPSFEGATGWLNSEPLESDDLRDHVVLADFWTLTCINWLRTEPYIRAWWHTYRDDGLVVVGVHTPEFSFEHDPERVRLATRERAIDYPVALDNDYAVWRAFGNNYWPALYFVDGEGRIRDHHFGEGRYEQSERMIQELLGVKRNLVSVRGKGVEQEADWDTLGSPETYLGSARNERQSTPDRIRLNEWALRGEWATDPEKVLLERASGSILFRFHARDAHLVLSRATTSPIPFRVLLDGEAPGASHGVDVDADGNGLLGDGRLYQLIRQPGTIEERTLEIAFLDGGAEAYVFTFG